MPSSADCLSTTALCQKPLASAAHETNRRVIRAVMESADSCGQWLCDHCCATALFGVDSRVSGVACVMPTGIYDDRCKVRVLA